MTTCDRCFRPARATSMSWFNTDTVCRRCSEDEEFCPNYETARMVEHDAVLAGNYSFPGIGLAPEDREVLARRRAVRADAESASMEELEAASAILRRGP